MRRCFLYHPDNSRPYYIKLHYHASKFSQGRIVFQRTGEGVNQVIIHTSENLNKSQVNCSTYEKEPYALYYTCTKAKQYILGRKVHILLDNFSLCCLQPSKF